MADGFVPPSEVRANAKRGLELRAKHGRGGTEVGVARARDLSNGASLSLDTINRMVSYFARHEVDKQGQGWGVDSAGYIAWLLWGGDAGRSWAKRISKENDKKDKANMATDYANSYAAIIKADENPDGTMTVYGKATDDSIDLDQQICDDAWMKSAMPEWMISGGNIREQHSQIAAGVAQEYENKADGHYISVLVVDPVSVKKVKTGVLKGFSVGIKNPRVVRDTKAAGGRIVGGQIIEVSLVDRPANPNAKLIMAKSVEGESTLIKAEEFHEYSAPLPTEIAKAKKPNFANVIPDRKGEPVDKELYARVIAAAKDKFDVYPSAYANAWVVQEYKKRGGKYRTRTEKEMQMAKASELIAAAKSLAADTVKFEDDEPTFNAARQALAQLIQSEAKEMETEGSNESDSISALLEAIHHLFAWRNSEVAEGETSSMENIELSAYKDSTTGCSCEGCKACKGCDDKMCAGHKSMKATDPEDDEDAEKSVTSKCLQCGCGQVGQDHGLTQVTIPGGAVANVSTATIVTPEQNAGSIKSAEADEVATEEVASEDSAPAEVADSAPSIEDVVEEAVKSAMALVKAKIDELESAKEAALEKSVKLESDLATALNKSVAAGPKRTAKAIGAVSNEYIVKAASYKAKADATTDPVLRKGYAALSAEFFAKAETPVENA